MRTPDDDPCLRLGCIEYGIHWSTTVCKSVCFSVCFIFRALFRSSGKQRFVEVATTRPETVLADVALAVHPDDPRHRHLAGKFVRHPIVPGRVLPVIADDAVKPNVGTGTLTIRLDIGTDPHSSFRRGENHTITRFARFRSRSSSSRCDRFAHCNHLCMHRRMRTDL